MTFRETLADWISGGKLAEARRQARNFEGWFHRRGGSLNEFFETNVKLRDKLKEAQQSAEYMMMDNGALRRSISNIEAEFRDGKSGTAQKAARMAREALK